MTLSSALKELRWGTCCDGHLHVSAPGDEERERSENDVHSDDVRLAAQNVKRRCEGHDRDQPQGGERREEGLDACDRWQNEAERAGEFGDPDESHKGLRKVCGELHAPRDKLRDWLRCLAPARRDEQRRKC